jgi:hypothetical protein
MQQVFERSHADQFAAIPVENGHTCETRLSHAIDHHSQRLVIVGDYRIYAGQGGNGPVAIVGIPEDAMLPLPSFSEAWNTVGPCTR